MKISMGGFGNQVAAPQQGPRVSPRAAGAPGAAVAQVGAEGMQVAGGLLEQQRAEQRRADEELRRMQSVRVMAQTKNELYDLGDRLSAGVLDGSIKADDAREQWDEGAAKVVGERTADLDPVAGEIARAQLLDSQHAVQTRVRAAITKRTQQEFGGELIATREALQRDAARDRAGANELWMRTLDTQGPLAGMTPEQIAADKQRFRESTAETEAYGLVHGAKNSMDALARVEKDINGDGFADLDPQRRAVLNNTIAGARVSIEQRAEVAARRAEIAAARRDRQASMAFDAAYKLSADGKVLAPEFAEKVAKTVAGTPYEAMLPQILNQAKEGSSFSMQPLNTQRALLDQMAARGNTQGWTPAEQERYARLDAANKAAVREYAEDPLRAAVERGVLSEMAPLDIRSPDAIAASVSARLQQAQQVSVVTGSEVSPFTRAEARQVGETLNALPIKQRTNAIAQIAGAIGARPAGALAAQLDPEDKPLALAFGYGRQMTTAGRFTSELVLKGAQAIKDKVVKVDNSTEVGWRAEIAKQARGAFVDPRLEDSIVDSAFYIQAGLAAEGTEDVDRALRLAAGRIVERNGAKVPLPAGWVDKQLTHALRTYPAANLEAQAPDGQVYAGKTAMPIDKFMLKLPQSPLRHAGQGRYAVSAGNGLVTNARGEPIIIDVLNALPAVKGDADAR